MTNCDYQMPGRVTKIQGRTDGPITEKGKLSNSQKRNAVFRPNLVPDRQLKKLEDNLSAWMAEYSRIEAAKWQDELGRKPKEDLDKRDRELGSCKVQLNLARKWHSICKAELMKMPEYHIDELKRQLEDLLVLEEKNVKPETVHHILRMRTAKRQDESAHSIVLFPFICLFREYPSNFPRLLSDSANL
jgi:hypothetical protein